MPRVDFNHDYKADLVWHLKRGPVRMPKSTAESLYLLTFPYGIRQLFGAMTIIVAPDTDNRKVLITRSSW